MSKKLILYSKPECHLCEGLREKLVQITELDFDLEIRDITTREDWFNSYQYEVPVLLVETLQGEQMIPRPSPRISITQLTKILQKYLGK